MHLEYILIFLHAPGDGRGDATQANPSVDPEEMFEARVDIRRFAQFLAGQQVNPSRVICSESQLTILS